METEGRQEPRADQPPIGKRYEGGRWEVTLRDTVAYADATDDPNPAYRGPAAVAPPMFHVRPFIDLMMTCARDPELGLDLLRLVHGEHAMRFLRPIRPGETLTLHGALESLVDKPSGRVATFALTARVGDEVVLDGRTTYFVRAPRRPDEPKAPKAAEPAPPPPTFSVPQVVAPDQADRYAPASGDHNPIHLDPEVAKRAGLPGVILHGLCTLAFAARDLVDRCCDGDPARLRSLSVRFARPVFPGQTLTLDVWQDAPGQAAFATRNDRGEAVITHGLARFDAGTAARPA